MQQSLHLRRIGSGICPANPFACEIAGEFVQFQSDCQSLFARHLTIVTNRESRARTDKHEAAIELGMQEKRKEFLGARRKGLREDMAL